MKTKIIVSALSGLALLSACDTSENTDSAAQNVSVESAPVNADANTSKAADTPVKSINESDAGTIEQDIAEPYSDKNELPGSEDDEFSEEAGHYEDDAVEADPDGQLMEEDAGGEAPPSTEANGKTIPSDAK